MNLARVHMRNIAQRCQLRICRYYDLTEEEEDNARRMRECLTSQCYVSLF